MCHALGFDSAADETADDRLMVWDLFRFASATASNGVNFGEFASTARDLRMGSECYSATLLNDSAWVYRMSTGQTGGDGNQADHWKADEILGTAPIGVMDPSLGANQDFSQGGYLKVPDRRALDALGWNINLNNVPQPPQPGQPSSPPNGQQRVGFRPVFQWTPGSGTETVNLYVFQGVVQSEATQVYAAEDLTANTHQMPYGILDENTTYTWMATCINAMGHTYSPIWSFSARCYADCNADGNLSVADFTCFQTMFSQGNIEADCNESGTLTAADYTCFQSRYSAGCP